MHQSVKALMLRKTIMKLPLVSVVSFFHTVVRVCFSLRFFSSLSGSVLLLFRYQEARTRSSAFLLLLRVVFSFSVSHTHCCPFSQELQQRKRESKCRISRLHCFQSRLLLHVGRLCFKTKIFSGCKRAFTGYCSQTCQCGPALSKTKRVLVLPGLLRQQLLD